MPDTSLILVVMHDEDQRSMVVDALHKSDLPMEIDGRLRHTADALLSFNPDVVVFDVAAMATLQEQDLRVLRSAGVEIVLAYGQPFVEGISEEATTWATDYIELPSTAEDMITRLKRARDLSRMRRKVAVVAESSRDSTRHLAVDGASRDADRKNRRITKRLSDLERLKSNLITIISHEFKTPLHLASGYIGILEDKTIGELNPEQRKAIETIHRQLTRLSDKLSDIERIAHLEMGLPSNLTEQIDLKVLLEREIEGFKSGLTKKSIVAEIDVPERLPLIKGCQDFLSDVFRRLIDNAIHYTDKGGVIHVAAKLLQHSEHGDGIEVSVQDSGCGIPPNLLPHVFDRFGSFRDIEHHSSRRSGLGLGLAICRHLVEVHEGAIAVESKVGEGSTFRVFLPTRRQD